MTGGFTAVPLVDGSVTPPKLAPGTNGQIMATIGGASTWITPASSSVSGSTSGPSTTSASFSVIPEMTTTVTTNGLPVLVSFDTSATVTSTLALGDAIEVALFLDGVEIAGTRRDASIGLGLVLTTVQHLGTFANVTPAAGSHTFDARFRRPSGTGAATCNGTLRSLVVKEIP